MRWLLAWPFLTPKAVCGTRCGNRREGEPDLWCGDCVPVLSRLAHTDVCVCARACVGFLAKVWVLRTRFCGGRYAPLVMGAVAVRVNSSGILNVV